MTQTVDKRLMTNNKVNLLKLEFDRLWVVCCDSISYILSYLKGFIFSPSFQFNKHAKIEQLFFETLNKS